MYRRLEGPGFLSSLNLGNSFLTLASVFPLEIIRFGSQRSSTGTPQDEFLAYRCVLFEAHKVFKNREFQ